MTEFMSKHRNWIIALIALVVILFGWKYWRDRKAGELPAGIASGNGRIEARLTDVAAKEPLRVKEIRVHEGDLVKPGQVVALLDTSTLESQLAEANAKVAAEKEQLAAADAAIVKRKSEVQLAQIEVERVRRMLAENASSQREYDVRKMTVATTGAALNEDMAKRETAQQQVNVALANVKTIQTRINDATLTSPVLGRVLYRLAEPGEVLAAGGKALTLVNLDDVYMEIFLPSEQAAAVRLGNQGRIVLDTQPDRPVTSYVTFVSPEAQFTPKEVETRSERDKLMFRVKLQVPRQLVAQYLDTIKTGVRGVGYVKYGEMTAWPSELQKNLLEPQTRLSSAAPPSGGAASSGQSSSGQSASGQPNVSEQAPAQAPSGQASPEQRSPDQPATGQPSVGQPAAGQPSSTSTN